MQRPAEGNRAGPPAAIGLPAEGMVHVSWNERAVTLVDGEIVNLRAPDLRIADLGFGALGDDVMLSPRVAPALVGMGLLDAVPAETLERLAARQSRDGIAGNPEITAQRLSAIEAYLRTLAVPARRDVADPQVVRGGGELFEAARCAVCHAPELRTGDYPAEPLLANQVIRPYTDLLLHDMGEELADHRPDYLASDREWRTPALWGMGLAAIVNGHSELLHNGRARNAAEAILWHGGEATVSREAFRAMPKADRAALLRFLASL
jgi:CxxC motif-containing protein (DUF1111 family)